MSFLKPCPSPGCSNLVTRGRCPLHSRDRALIPSDPDSPSSAPEVRLSHRHKAFYASPAWQKARRLYLSLHPVCEICTQALSSEVHHLESLESRPDLALDPENFQATCKPCHSRETVRQDGGFGRAPQKGEG